MLEYTETYRSPVNSSKSKQLYSFPKESRFKFQKLDTSFMYKALYLGLTNCITCRTSTMDGRRASATASDSLSSQTARETHPHPQPTP